MKTLLHYQIQEVEPYINWLYFFHAWGFPSQYASVAQIHYCPSCCLSWTNSFPENERNKSSEALHLFDDAQTLLHKLNGQIQTHAIVELFQANGDGDDIIIYEDNGGIRKRIPFLRQQHGATCYCWADFVSCLNRHGQDDSPRIKDRIGLFACTVDERMVTEPINPGDIQDDYSQLLCQTLADRLAEATTEKMHEEVRKRLWGYAKNESHSIESMFQEKYIGIRPAVGYPSLPDQSINFLIDEIIDMKEIGIHLSESGAMQPHASTSGLLFAHPEARHFAIGPIGEDQLQDYAQRRGIPVSEMRKFLANNLKY